MKNASGIASLLKYYNTFHITCSFASLLFMSHDFCPVPTCQSFAPCPTLIEMRSAEKMSSDKPRPGLLLWSVCSAFGRTDESPVSNPRSDPSSVRLDLPQLISIPKDTGCPRRPLNQTPGLRTSDKKSRSPTHGLRGSRERPLLIERWSEKLEQGVNMPMTNAWA